jgi:pimeloyl-[acyl-carrier protein] methyl ester esterase
MRPAEIRGSGPDLVMVHGWGMHAGVWSDWVDSLSGHFRIHLVELPGHGGNGYDVGPSLDDWSLAVARQVPGPAWWLGWSLGALVAMNVARLCPLQVRGLVLISGTPRFVTAPDWPCAVDTAVFDQFAAQLAQDPERTLVRFLSLQVRGAEGDGGALRRLRTLLRERPYPQARALHDGLQLLQHCDVRGILDSLDAPLFWLFGERDTLVPAAVSARLPGRRETVEGAGHAPFLSHPRVCTAHIRRWLLQDAEYGQHAAV